MPAIQMLTWLPVGVQKDGSGSKAVKSILGNVVQDNT